MTRITFHSARSNCLYGQRDAGGDDVGGVFRVTAVTAGCLGGIGSAVYGLMIEQSKRARRAIGSPTAEPPCADGVYLPDGSGPLCPDDAEAVDAIRLAVLGDSSAAGLGAEHADALPGVAIARGLADESGRAVRLSTFAVSGSTSRQLAAQVELAVPGRPDVVVVLIGANDVTNLTPPPVAAGLLADAVRRLRSFGAAVVVGTCPDLGVVQPIRQPLRGFVHTWSVTLARLQRTAVRQAGGSAVALADLLAGEFLARPDYFSSDRYHPSGLGYAAVAAVMLPAVCAALGVDVSAASVVPLPTHHDPADLAVAA